MMKSRRVLLSYEKNSSGGLVPSRGSLADRAFLSSQEANISGFRTAMILSDKSSNDSSPSDNPYGNPYDLSARFNPSMAIIIVVLLSAFFFMGFFSIYVRRCTSEEDAGGNSRRGGGNRRMNAGPQGLEKTLIDSFPLFSYSLVKGLKQGKESLECAVCLSEFEEDETLRLLPKCGHTFHPDCIDMWLFSHTTCPLCRCSLVPESATVEEGTMASMEGQPPLDSSQATEQVVIVLGRGNSEQDRTDSEIEHQGRGLNELNPIDAGLSLANSDGAPIHYNEHSSSATSSPILGVVNALRPLETRSQSFRRSHSTGHSLVRLRGNPEHPSELYISTDNRYAIDFSEGLLGLSAKSALHRSSSCAGFSHFGSQEISHSDGFFDVTERLWRFPSSTEPSGFEEAYARFYHEPGTISEIATDRELARLSEIHFDPRIKSDRWNISVRSPFFFRTLSESRAPFSQQQLPSISPPASNESFSHDRKAYLQYLEKSLMWLTGRDKRMGSNNCPGPSRQAEQVFAAALSLALEEETPCM